MQTTYFNYVLEIARHGSITKAANNLWISQQALSKILEHVEIELGFRIFERTNKGVVATLKGEKVLSDMERILTIMHEWQHEKEDKYRTRIFLQFILSDLVLDENFMLALNSEIQIDVEWETMSPPEMVKRIKSGEKSWGILIASPQADIYPKLKKTSPVSKLKAEIIGETNITQMVILLRHDDPLAFKDTINLSDLTEKEFVINKGILVTESPQKLAAATKKDVRILPVTVNTVDYITQHENTFTCLPGFIAYNNLHVTKGDVVIKKIADTLDENLCCYLLFHADQILDMNKVVIHIRNYFNSLIAEL